MWNSQIITVDSLSFLTIFQVGQLKHACKQKKKSTKALSPGHFQGVERF